MIANNKTPSRGDGQTASAESGTEYMDCSPSKRFQVHKWQAVAMWAYDISVDNCAICRNHIMDKCIECQSVQELTDYDGQCSIAWGKCSHVFHMHCISRWLGTRQVCPLDNRTWEFKRKSQSTTTAINQASSANSRTNNASRR